MDHDLRPTIILTVLINDTFGALLELVNRLIFPPVIQVAKFVELPSLIIKTMRQLVSHDHTHGAIVQARRERRVVERTLQNASREDHLIFGWSVVGVDCLWWHTLQK